MKKLFCLVIFVAMLISGCGFHLQNNAEIPAQFKKMIFNSYDPYGKLSKEIKKTLSDNHVELANSANDVHLPSLYIQNSQLSKDTISIYQDGKSAEYQLILTVDANVIIADDDIYPITVKVFRTFFDNPATALAKSTEQTLIEHEMQQQAAIQLIGKLKSINPVIQK